MPASTIDPVNAALRTALTKSSGGGGGGPEGNKLDIQLAGATKKALLSNIEFESAGSYQSTVLDKLKTKYIVLKSTVPNNLPLASTSGTSSSSSSASENNNSSSNSNSKSDMGGDETLSLAKHELYPLHAVQLGWNNIDWSVGAGMVNMGNTCYLNSTLQALFHVPSLVNWLVSDKQHMSECEDSGGYCIICAMRKTLQDSQQRNTNSIRPFLIYNKLRVVCRNLIPGRQEDAHEFLRYLVEAMEKSYLNRFKNHAQFDSRTKETTPLNQILGGYLRSAVRCLDCGHVSTTFQHFQDLLLDIRKAQTLDEALDGYFSREQLDDESYRCEACQKKVPATKQFSLERAPMVLCIQLKRFSVTNNKITKHVQFKQRLELTKYARHRPPAPLVYRLVALVTHMGPTVGCGHYTAVAQAPCGNFYQFDDSMVRPISHQAVFTTNAYIMLYELEQAPPNLKPSAATNGVSKLKPLTPNNSLLTSNTKPQPEKIQKRPSSSTANTSASSSTNENGSAPVVYGPELPPKVRKTEEQNGTVTSSLSIICEESGFSSDNDEKAVASGSSSTVVSSTTTKLVPYDEDDTSSDDSQTAAATKATNGEWKVTSSTDNILPSEECRKKLQPSTPNDRSTVNELLKMSHSGYSAPVASWNGTRAQLDKEVANEKREERKRALSGPDEADQGRVKHVKTSNGSYKSNPGYNAFQEYQNNGNGYRQYYGNGGRHRNNRRNFHHKNNYHNKNYRFRH